MGLLQDVEETKRMTQRHEEQISGRQGLIVAIAELASELKGVKRALYTAAGGFVLAAVGFGFAAMRLTGAG